MEPKIKPRIFCSWGLGVSMCFVKAVDVYVDSMQVPENNDSVKILLLVEPPEILTTITDYALKNYMKYDFIFTYNDVILRKCSNARFFLANDTWIRNDFVLKDKSFDVSAVVGAKRGTKGHKVRHDLWNSKDRIVNIPKKFFASSQGNPPNLRPEDLVLGDTKYPLFDSQFHIVIENAQMKNMFSEKLLDCLVTKTVPILWGCPNIGDFFDIRGFKIANTCNDIINICNSLNENTYDSMKEYVEYNFIEVQKHLNLDKKLGDSIRAILS